MRLFVSYARQDRAKVDTLVSDVERLGHEVWYDHDLTGGATWWNEILSRIRECDALLFILSSNSSRSDACRLEAQYGAELARPILPVRVEENVSLRLLPACLAERQYVDHLRRDADSSIALTRALVSLPPGTPLPDPLPEPPAVPISYLTSLAERVGAQQLSGDEQRAVMAELRARVANEEQRTDVAGLLRTMRGRADLLASVALDIDSLLSWVASQRPPTTPGPNRGSARVPSAATHWPPPANPPPRPPAPRNEAPGRPAGARRWGRVVVIGLAVLGALVVAGLAAGLAEDDPPAEDPICFFDEFGELVCE